MHGGKLKFNDELLLLLLLEQTGQIGQLRSEKDQMRVREREKPRSLTASMTGDASAVMVLALMMNFNLHQASTRVSVSGT